MKKVCIITGGSSGIGLETTKVFRDEGYTVYEFSRRGCGAEGVKHISCDVTDEAAVKRAVDSVVSGECRIDILVNSAGFGISGLSRRCSIPGPKTTGSRSERSAQYRKAFPWWNV